MWSRSILMAVATAVLATGVAQAQDSDKNDDATRLMTQKLRDELTARGFRDVKVKPGSFVVSAKDKGGQRILMMIGPAGTTVMKMPDENPSQAQTPNKDDDQIIQQ